MLQMQAGQVSARGLPFREFAASIVICNHASIHSPRYCSPACQKAHWNAHHKKNCFSQEELLEKAAAKRHELLRVVAKAVANILRPNQSRGYGNPAVACDKHVYDKATIEKHFEYSDASPVTGVQVPSTFVIRSCFSRANRNMVSGRSIRPSIHPCRQTCGLTNRPTNQ